MKRNVNALILCAHAKQKDTGKGIFGEFIVPTCLMRQPQSHQTQLMVLRSIRQQTLIKRFVMIPPFFQVRQLVNHNPCKNGSGRYAETSVATRISAFAFELVARTRETAAQSQRIFSITDLAVTSLYYWRRIAQKPTFSLSIVI